MMQFARLSTHLYDILLRPVDDLFERNLIIVANKEMDGFPFHAIERQDAKGNVKYVIELTSIDYVPSIASLRYRAVSAARLQDVVAFGNPTGKNWSVDYELRDIRSFFKGARVMVGLETSWDNLKSTKADILQISTEFSQRNAEFPLGNFVLSNGLMVEQSTIIPFEKLAELEAIPVIALSNHHGQGVGLSAEHALLLRLNGTPDIFFNAWSADRKAAKFFSEYFFTHLANGLAPGDAYRQALLNLIRTREVSHPRSWGQFFHFGVG
jgi:CHAT domain-containing protein